MAGAIKYFLQVRWGNLMQGWGPLMLVYFASRLLNYISILVQNKRNWELILVLEVVNFAQFEDTVMDLQQAFIE